jgi:hypothetical protein
MPSIWIVAAAAVIGAGVSAYGQYQSGKAQERIAFANAREQERQAQNALTTLQMQSRMQSAQTDINFRMRKAEADARKGNAEQLEGQARQQDAINRANMRKQREEYARQQATARTNIAASGLVESSGTPLDLLAETASAIQKDASEHQFTAEQQRRTIFREADMERLGGELALQGATLDRNTGLTTAAFTALQGRAEYNAGMRRAEITRLTGKAARQAANTQAVATIFSGVGSAAGGFN